MGENPNWLSGEDLACLRKLDDVDLRRLLTQRHSYKSAIISDGSGKERSIDRPMKASKVVQRIVIGIISDKVSVFLPPQCTSKRGKSHTVAVQKGKRCIEAGQIWQVSLDVKSFYSHIDRKTLRRILLKSGLFSQRLIRLMFECLSVSTCSKGKGLPTGAPLSPLLANLYLSPLTLELSARGLAYYQHIDDFGFFFRTQQSALTAAQKVSIFLETKLSLPINSTKTGVNGGNSYNLLGFELVFRGDKLITRPAQTNINRLEQKVLVLIETFQKDKDVEALIESLNKKLKGWASAFKISTDAVFLKDLDGYIYSAVFEAVYYAFPHYSHKCAALALLTGDKRLARKLASMNPERALEGSRTNGNLVSLYATLKQYRKSYKKAG